MHRNRIFLPSTRVNRLSRKLSLAKAWSKDFAAASARRAARRVRKNFLPFLLKSAPQVKNLGLQLEAALPGTLFRLGLEPPALQIAICPSGENLELRWPTNVAGLPLQFVPHLGSAWTAVAAAPEVINGKNTLATSISGAQGFYRLAQ